MQISYKTCLILSIFGIPAKERSVLVVSVDWDLKIMCYTDASDIKCSLNRGFVMRVSLSFHLLLRKVFVARR